MKPPDINKFVSEAAQKIGHRILRCDVCGAQLDCPPGRTAEYLTSGWPECCGYTMRLL